MALAHPTLRRLGKIVMMPALLHPDAVSEARPTGAGGPLVCIVIPVHNRRELTLACLDRLSWCADDTEWKIILVDDASSDGTRDAVRSLHPHVEIVEGDGQLFWTGGMRRGMARALQLGCTEVIWLNDDTLPNEGSLRRIAEMARLDPQQLVASMALLNGKPQACCGLRRKGVQPVAGMLLPADVLAGYQVAFSVAVVKSIGLPDAVSWPHYGGDSSFTRMAHDAGFRLLVDGGSFVDLNDAPPRASAAEAFWKGCEPLTKKIERVFFAKGSRHRLRSLWNLDCLYRGLPGALLVFPARLIMTAWNILRCRPSRTASPKKP